MYSPTAKWCSDGGIELVGGAIKRDCDVVPPVQPKDKWLHRRQCGELFQNLAAVWATPRIGPLGFGDVSAVRSNGAFEPVMRGAVGVGYDASLDLRGNVPQFGMGGKRE